MKRILGWCDAFARKIAFVAAMLLAASAQAFNWSDYPAGAVVTVTGNATATDADMATINAYSKLCFASGTRITFDVSGDVSLTCPVAATGTIVKCGTGSFALTASASNGSGNTFRYIDFEVEEGVLKTPQDPRQGHQVVFGRQRASHGNQFAFQRIVPALERKRRCRKARYHGGRQDWQCRRTLFDRIQHERTCQPRDGVAVPLSGRG